MPLCINNPVQWADVTTCRDNKLLTDEMRRQPSALIINMVFKNKLLDLQLKRIKGVTCRIIFCLDSWTLLLINEYSFLSLLYVYVCGAYEGNVCLTYRLYNFKKKSMVADCSKTVLNH